MRSALMTSRYATLALFAAARLPHRASRTPFICCARACASSSSPSNPDATGDDSAAVPLTPRGLSEGQKKVIAYRQQYKCAACDCLLPPTYEVDHVTPLALGGTNGLGNLQALCSACHVQKTRDQRAAVLEARASRLGVPTRTDPVIEALKANTRPHGDTHPVEHEGSALPAAAVSSVEELDSLSLSLSPLKLLRGMNAQQLRAVLHTEGPVRVAAGPGTGKTRVLTARIAHLVANQRVPPSRVVAVTFTNKAARELRERITALLGPARADAVTMGTFHSLCLSLLRADIHKLQPELPYRRGFAVYDADAMVRLVGDVMSMRAAELAPSASIADHRTAAHDKAHEPAATTTATATAAVRGRPRGARAFASSGEEEAAEMSAPQVQSIISNAKNRGLDAAGYAVEPGAKPYVARVFNEYERILRMRNVVDFDDMLVLTVRLLSKSDALRRRFSSLWSYVHVVTPPSPSNPLRPAPQPQRRAYLPRHPPAPAPSRPHPHPPACTRTLPHAPSRLHPRPSAHLRHSRAPRCLRPCACPGRVPGHEPHAVRGAPTPDDRPPQRLRGG